MEWVMIESLGRVRYYSDPHKIPRGLLGVGCPGIHPSGDPSAGELVWIPGDLPDGRRVGVRTVAEHLQTLPEYAAAIGAALATKKHPQKWRAGFYVVRVTGTRPEPRPDLPVDADDAHEFVERCAGRPIEVRGQVATICGTRIEDLPEKSMRRLFLDAVLVRNGEARAIMGLGLPLTLAPRAALQRYLEQADADLVARRAVVEDEARKNGCAIVYGYSGVPVRQPAPDVGRELAALRARIADLEAERRSGAA